PTRMTPIAGCESAKDLGRRGADDPQNLSHRRLLLQGLSELLFQVGIVRSRLRCLRTKTGNACSALRTFVRQGHLVGTATGPPSGRPSQRSRLSILTEPHGELAVVHSITLVAANGCYGILERVYRISPP